MKLDRYLHPRSKYYVTSNRCHSSIHQSLCNCWTSLWFCRNQSDWRGQRQHSNTIFAWVPLKCRTENLFKFSQYSKNMTDTKKTEGVWLKKESLLKNWRSLFGSQIEFFQEISLKMQLKQIITYLFLFPRMLHNLRQHYQIFTTENRDNLMWITSNRLVDKLILTQILCKLFYRYLCCFSDSLRLVQTKQIQPISWASACLAGRHSRWNDRLHSAQSNDAFSLWQIQQNSSFWSCSVEKNNC